jgi:uncharacterized protein (TIGR03084 family)
LGQDAQVEKICDDLAAEHADLDRIVAPIAAGEWERPTPAAGWAVRDQIGHLWYFDRSAHLAATDADAFRRSVEQLLSDPAGLDAPLAESRALAADALLDAWRAGRAALLDALRALDPSTRLPWYGPDMAARTFATARLMETWAHGQDVADALGATRAPTARLRHIAHIGVRTRGFSYVVRGRTPPEGDVRVELRAPDGDVWVWGESATDAIHGDALDFCLVVTQRRHRADTGLEIAGPLAEEWMAIAQAYAGPPGDGREPGAVRDR